MGQMSERETSFELIEALLRYCKETGTPGAVLIFLPGWNLIFALLRHLQQHPTFGGSRAGGTSAAQLDNVRGWAGLEGRADGRFFMSLLLMRLRS